MGDTTMFGVDVLVTINHLETDNEVADGLINRLIFIDDFADTVEINGGIGALGLADDAENSANFEVGAEETVGLF